MTRITLLTGRIAPLPGTDRVSGIGKAVATEDEDWDF